MPLHPSRLTIDLERPVGLQPLTVRTAVVRHGKKVHVAEAQVFDDSSTRLVPRQPAGHPPHARTARPRRRRPPHRARPTRTPGHHVGRVIPVFAVEVEGPMYHQDAVEHRFTVAASRCSAPRPTGSACVPVLDDDPVSPLQRVAAAADFGNGISGSVPAGWVFINPDLTVTLHRLPVGEWVCLDSATHFGPDGTGSADADCGTRPAASAARSRTCSSNRPPERRRRGAVRVRARRWGSRRCRHRAGSRNSRS